MYTIFADGNLLYSSLLEDEGYVVLDPKLNLEVNKAGSLDFTLPTTNPMYNSLNKLKTIITVEENGVEIFRGRVLHDSMDFYKRKAVYCEGELAFLLDSPLRPYEFQGSPAELFSYYISCHNEAMGTDTSKQFTVGYVSVTDSNSYIVRSNSDYTNVWDELNEKLIDLLGGYLRIRVDEGVRYIDYLAEGEHVDPEDETSEIWPSTNSQVIKFGYNLLDLTEYITAEDVITCLIPLGAEIGEDDTKERLTIKSVNDNKDYIIDDDAVELFGRVWGINTWDDVTIADNLLTKAKAYLKDSIYTATTLTIKAVDMHLTDSDIEKFNLYDKVEAVSVPHNFDYEFMCTAMTVDLVNPGNTEYTFGNVPKTLTSNWVVSK